MKVFQDISLEWNGDNYSIRGDDNIMTLISRVEDVLPLGQLYDMSKSSHINMSRLATAFAVMLRHAGCEVSTPEVYAGMFQGDKPAQNAQLAIAQLIALMVPPEEVVTQDVKKKSTTLKKKDPSHKKPSN